MLEEKSVGAVVFHRENGGLKYLLLHYTAGHFDWPKGNVEKNETEVETARREIGEETGIGDLTFVPGFRDVITYFYRRQGQTVRKQVVFLLAEAHSSSVKISWEHVGYAWLKYEDSLRVLTYENSRHVLRKAHKMLAEGLERFAEAGDKNPPS